MTCSGVSENHPVRPIDIVPVELDCLCIVELWVGEQVALRILPR